MVGAGSTGLLRRRYRYLSELNPRNCRHFHYGRALSLSWRSKFPCR